MPIGVDVALLRMTAGALLAFLATGAAAQTTAILFENVRVFDSAEAVLTAPQNVLVTGNTIAEVTPEPISPDPGLDLTVVAGDGRVLIPGLIDAHVHITLNTIPLDVLATADPNYTMIRSAAAAGAILQAGYTTVRDLGGPAFGLKRAIDEGIVPGPRIYPSGPMISQTSGHSDFRALSELPSSVDRGPVAGVRFGYNDVADGVPAMHVAVRENLMQGASQIKLAVGGGVSSNYDPIDVTEYTPEEVRAAVLDAENWGTYVTVHAYTPRAVRMAIEAGVRSIEHGQLLDEDTIRLMAERGVWLSLQPFLEDEDAIPTVPGSENEAKYRQVAEGTARAYELAKKHGVKLAFGTDIQMNPQGAERQAFYLPKLKAWFTPAEILKQATHDNAQLLALSGPRNPYPNKLGVIEKGAYADMILVDGDPTQDIDLLADPEENFVIIVKDGTIVRSLSPMAP